MDALLAMASVAADRSVTATDKVSLDHPACTASVTVWESA